MFSCSGGLLTAVVAQVDMCAAQLSLTLPCLLMLTGNGDFNTNAQNSVTEPAQLSWCAEWAVADTKLSSVLLLVLLRAVTSSLHTHSSMFIHCG